ncbi:hypothetical protein HMPREF3100_12810 [Enterococcus sp. HMSC29A04]|uniref:hypothetical protein n=1 Tax=Enterococcus TaxID=1350 RepID=UPI0007F36A42|nr:MULTISPECIES: hypothetical protein [Enterococcus]SAM60926.1 hypothetical protein DTPHA_1401562 [Enterococcus faecium]MZJ56147.1 hypothetical protein [Enterococcus avium]MZJ76764.1 hypothetical protein [Enterococcus avium]MZJ80927.1 hypothetical protein [Enterococcus avium]MZJ87188.1 hypothetical protein [Enterococcus avium]
MLNKKNILGIIQDHQDQIEVIESELQRAKHLDLDIPDLTIVARKELSYLYENKARFEMQARAWGLIKEESE